MISSDLTDTFASVSLRFDNLICHCSWTVLLSRKTFATERSVSRNTSPDGVGRTSVKGSRWFLGARSKSFFFLPTRCPWPCNMSRTGHPPLSSRCGGNILAFLKPNEISKMSAVGYWKHRVERMISLGSGQLTGHGIEYSLKPFSYGNTSLALID